MRPQPPPAASPPAAVPNLTKAAAAAPPQLERDAGRRPAQPHRRARRAPPHPRRYPLHPAPAGADEAAKTAAATIAQLDDYLLPRLRRLDAPLLVVVVAVPPGGQVDAGQQPGPRAGQPAGVLRPTTRAPVLVCHPADRRGSRDHLLPGHGPHVRPSTDPNSLQVVTAAHLDLRAGVPRRAGHRLGRRRNRALATQLLAAADLWLFVTTAARYADAVPWALLRTRESAAPSSRWCSTACHRGAPTRSARTS
jgi:hypothetical protein